MQGQELDSIIIVGLFQIRTFHDSMISNIIAHHSRLVILAYSFNKYGPAIHSSASSIKNAKQNLKKKAQVS